MTEQLDEVEWCCEEEEVLEHQQRREGERGRPRSVGGEQRACEEKQTDEEAIVLEVDVVDEQQAGVEDGERDGANRRRGACWRSARPAWPPP